MSAPPLVFLGPSLPSATARRILAADYRPPVRRGDLPQRYPGIVVIIDGEFGQSLSVSPNEILRLLDDATSVIGAASMGALRAAELHTYGMRGYGWVFEAYRTGHVTADDEVAVTFSAEDLAALTVPLINVRFWLEQLTADGEIDKLAARRMLARARRVFYADRTLQRLKAEWTNLDGLPDIGRLLATTKGAVTDVKATDAELALHAVRQRIQGGVFHHEH